MNKLNGLKHKKSVVELEIKQEKDRLHKELLSTHKRWFRVLDISLIIIILFNMGSVVLTNMMVVKESVEKEEPIKYLEVNPVAAKDGGYKQHPEAVKLFSFTILTIVAYAVFILIYIYKRTTIYNKYGLMFLTGIIVYWLTGTALDFFNNFGYFLGELVF